MRILLTLTLLAFATSAQAQFEPPYGPTPNWPPQERFSTPNVHGIWYMSGNEYAPTRIEQSRRGNGMLFINERGESAEGFIQGNRINVPDWGDRSRGGLEGQLQRNSIRWSNGTFWTR